MTYKVLIVGAGTKGAFYDRPGDEKVLSHAHAFTLNPAFEVVGFVDPDLKKAELACERWNAPMAYADGFEVREPIDVVVVATPDKTHANVIEDFLQLHPKLLVCEKPFCTSLAEARMIKDYCDRAKVPVLVNYTRRFCSYFILLSMQIWQGDYGKFLGGSAFYGNGFIHSASHWVNLFFLLGIPPDGVELIEINRESVNIFEATLLFERSKIEIRNHGGDVWEFKAVPRPDFPLDKIYSTSASFKRSNVLQDAMPNMVSNVKDFLEDSTPFQDKSASLWCRAIDAIKVHEFIEAHGHG